MSRTNVNTPIWHTGSPEINLLLSDWFWQCCLRKLICLSYGLWTNLRMALIWNLVDICQSSVWKSVLNHTLWSMGRPTLRHQMRHQISACQLYYIYLNTVLSIIIFLCFMYCIVCSNWLSWHSRCPRMPDARRHRPSWELGHLVWFTLLGLIHTVQTNKQTNKHPL